MGALSIRNTISTLRKVANVSLKNLKNSHL